MPLDPNFSTATDYFFYGRLNDIQGDSNMSVELDESGDPCMFLGKYIESRHFIQWSYCKELVCAVFENGSVNSSNFKHIVEIDVPAPPISPPSPPTVTFNKRKY